MKRILSVLKRLVSRRSKEYKIFYTIFNSLTQEQIKYIVNVVNEELKKSLEFGLKLQPEDESREKLVILSVFNAWGKKLNYFGKMYSVSEYEFITREIKSIVFEILKNEIKYYFDITPVGETRNRYNCHLDMLMSRLIADFIDQRCAPSVH